MLRLRQEKREHIFMTETKTAFILTLFYSIIKTIVEYTFYIVLGGAFDIAIFFVGFALLFLTVYMIILLFLTLKALTRGNAWPVLILTVLFGIDTMSALTYIPLFPESLMLIAYPLSSTQAFLLNDSVNVLFLCGISLFKVMMAIILLKFIMAKIEYV
jgi:hypothetical protein